MKNSFGTFVFCGLLIAAPRMTGASDAPPEAATPTSWKLTFSDEFDAFDP